MVRVARERRADVLWVGGEGPGPDPGDAEVRACLAAKLRRNISLGVLEAVLCVDSAGHCARDRLGLAGDELRGALRRSRGLCAGLAALHDDQECQRLTYLTGRPGPLEYPAVDYPDVLAGRVRIAAGRFVAVRHPHGPRLRFVSRPAGPLDPAAGPAMRCPAQQRRPAGSGATVNDALWDLIVELFGRAGHLD
jgi:hypothetical protein